MIRALSFVVALFIAATTHAATVRQTSVAEMIERCELIFEGRATATGTEESEDGRNIFTWVDFEVLDIVKGPNVGPSIRLHFLGGTFGERRIEIGGMRIPGVGERGVYFVEDPSRRQIHPLFGWDQGRLRVEVDAGGTPRVLSADGQPVVALRPSQGGSGASAASGSAISRGVASEVALRPGAPRSEAMSLVDLKTTLRRRLAGAAQ